MSASTAADVASCVLKSVTDEQIVLAVPGTDYQLHLVPTVPAGDITTAPGKRLRGRIEAKALRVHPSKGGGRFIEPVWGAPRIVAGTVRSACETSGRVLVDLGVPVWITPPDGQDASVFQVGELVNCYVESGVTFTPAE